MTFHELDGAARQFDLVFRCVKPAPLAPFDHQFEGLVVLFERLAQIGGMAIGRPLIFLAVGKQHGRREAIDVVDR